MDMQRIGSFLAQLRKERSLTQEQLARQLGPATKPFPVGRPAPTFPRWKCSSCSAKCTA